jgi:hypothetical protein
MSHLLWIAPKIGVAAGYFQRFDKRAGGDFETAGSGIRSRFEPPDRQFEDDVR